MNNREEWLRKRITAFLNCPDWICPTCKLTNFGRNKECADRKCMTVRPVGEGIEQKWNKL